MNKIYIINEYLSCEIILVFLSNKFELNNVFYNFDLIDKDKLLIYWGENDVQTFYTEDSYIFYSSTYYKDILKKLFIIHTEWHDQIILNFEKKKLFRVDYKNETGKFYYDEIDRLVIEWNNWGTEIFEKIDEYTYKLINYKNEKIEEHQKIEEDGKIEDGEKIEEALNVPIHIFIHICTIEDWAIILDEQINLIKNSGLYNIVEKIHLGILGDIHLGSVLLDYDEKIEIMYIDEKIHLYEIPTINSIKSFCDNLVDHSEAYILYIHTKGVRNSGNKNVMKSWRNMMEYFLIENYKECLKNLEIYDTLGNNPINNFCVDKKSVIINDNHAYHYSGNFWWSKKTYIDKLDYINIDYSKNSINTRYRAENWILSKYPDCNTGVLFWDNTNTHPYHRYVFDYYRNMKVFVKIL
jgi:hypothetical protein